MQPDDAAGVAALTGQLGYPATESDISRRYASILAGNRQASGLLVAERGTGVIVGWIHVQETQLLEADSRAEIRGLVVAEDARGSGVGRLLVEAAEAWATGRGLDTVAVRSNIVRLSAHAFYEHLGYRVVKTQKAMKKHLSTKIHEGHEDPRR